MLDYVIAYKQVNKNLSSFHDPKFIYKVNDFISVSNFDNTNVSCASGLHFSNATYWENNCDKESIYLMCKIMLKDIITVQEGKIRAIKCFVMDKSS